MLKIVIDIGLKSATRKIVFTILFLLLPIMVRASSAVVKLQQTLAAIHTLTANFTQTLYDNQGVLLQQSHGTVAIRRPGQFRWQINLPLPQLIIANDNRLWIYNPRLKQVIITQLNRAIEKTPISLLSLKHSDIAAKFNVSQQGDRFVLVAKNKKSHFSYILLRFHHNVLIYMRLQSALGQMLSIHFSKVKVNISLPYHYFNFVAPSGSDIVKQAL